MQNKLRIFIFIVFLLFTPNLFAIELNEAKVHEVLKKMDVAVRNMDAASVGRFLSEDVSILFHQQMDGEKLSMRLTKQQYIFALKLSWQEYETFDYEIFNLDIKINNNKKATLNMTLLENGSSKSEIFSANSKQKLVLELIDDKLLFTHIFSDSDIQISAIMKAKYIKSFND